MSETKILDRSLNPRSSLSKIAWGGLVCGSVLIALLSLIAWMDWEWGRGVFSHLCHQRSDRCLTVGGTAMAVCARCLGIYGGIGLGCGISVFSRSRFELSSTYLGISLLGAVCANGLDFLLESWQVYGNLPILRLVLGLSLGVSLALFVLGRAVSASLAREDRGSNRLPSGVSQG